MNWRNFGQRTSSLDSVAVAQESRPKKAELSNVCQTGQRRNTLLKEVLGIFTIINHAMCPKTYRSNVSFSWLCKDTTSTSNYPAIHS